MYLKNIPELFTQLRNEREKKDPYFEVLYQILETDVRLKEHFPLKILQSAKFYKF